VGVNGDAYEEWNEEEIVVEQLKGEEAVVSRVWPEV